MRTIKKVIKIAHSEQKPWEDELTTFLRNYRATPHSTTGKPPATVMFNRSLRITLPEVPDPTKDPANIQQADQAAKQKMKQYADRKSYVKPSNLKPGDTVLLKRDKSYNKSTSPYETKPYIVVKRKGSMITAKRGTKLVTRNTSFFKVIPHTKPVDDDLIDDDDSYYDDLSDNGDTHPQQDLNQQRLQPPVHRRYPQRTRKAPDRF